MADTDELRWIEPLDNVWGVRALDVRPVTLETDCFTLDPACSDNALSFESEDGLVFADATPAVSRQVSCRLTYKRDGILADGVLFAPREMEHKWALFFHRGRILMVRSWLRQVCLIAHVEQTDDEIVVTSIEGALSSPPEDAAMTIRVVDFLIRSHALRDDIPAPLPAHVDEQQAGRYCLTVFGNMARYASVDPILSRPAAALKSQSLLHIAAARGDVSAVEAELAKGVPLSLMTPDGLTAMHWALADSDTGMLGYLMGRGMTVDTASAEQATPLMIAAHRGLSEHARFLLDHGADPNSQDVSGYTALHRAAGQGDVDMVQLLLDHGANPSIEASGKTARSLALEHQEHEVATLLERAL